MFRNLIVTVVAVIGLGLAGQAMAQQGGPGEGGPGGGRGGRGNFDPAAMQKMMLDRVKTELAATDDEWKVLEPKLEEVMKLQREQRMGTGMGMMGMMGGRRNRDGAASDAAPATPPALPADASESTKKMADLQKVLQTKDAKPEDIKTALTALREARAKAKADLEKAQKELVGLLQVKQEAQLVTMGILD
jgi:hypothetical protein